MRSAAGGQPSRHAGERPEPVPTPFKPHPEDRPYLRRLAWTIVVAALLLVVWRAAHLLILGFGAVIGAVVFRTAARVLQRIGIRPWRVALPLGILLVLGVFGLMAWLLTAAFGRQMMQLMVDLPDIVREAEAALGRTPVGDTLVSAARAALGGSTFADQLAALGLGAGEVLLNFVILLVGAMFIASDPDVYRRGIGRLAPEAVRPEVEHALDEISLALRLWLRAQLISMVTMGLLVAAALWVVGVESWAALGLLAALSEFVPYVGPTLAMVPALAIAAREGMDSVGLVLFAYFAVRMIQSNLITPVVTRRVVAIPPALTLFVILGTGAVFGFYGLFFSAAMLVVAFVGVRELYLRDTLGEAGIKAVPRAKRSDG